MSSACPRRPPPPRRACSATTAPNPISRRNSIAEARASMGSRRSGDLRSRARTSTRLFAVRSTCCGNWSTPDHATTLKPGRGRAPRGGSDPLRRRGPGRPARPWRRLRASRATALGNSGDQRWGENRDRAQHWRVSRRSSRSPATATRTHAGGDELGAERTRAAGPARPRKRPQVSGLLLGQLDPDAHTCRRLEPFSNVGRLVDAPPTPAPGCAFSRPASPPVAVGFANRPATAAPASTRWAIIANLPSRRCRAWRE
jgi:hypothetical protein